MVYLYWYLFTDNELAACEILTICYYCHYKPTVVKPLKLNTKLKLSNILRETTVHNMFSEIYLIPNYLPVVDVCYNYSGGSICDELAGARVGMIRAEILFKIFVVWIRVVPQRRIWTSWRLSCFCASHEEVCGSRGITTLILNIGTGWRLAISLMLLPLYPCGQSPDNLWIWGCLGSIFGLTVL